MVTHGFRLLTAFAMLAVSLSFIGCSDDDKGTDPNADDANRLNVVLKAGSTFTYNRWDLDSTNKKIDASLRTYTSKITGNNGLLLGIYDDWYYRIGTDGATQKKDTLRIRVDQAVDGSKTYAKKIQVYGFQTQIMQMFVAMVAGQNPLVTAPTVPGPSWDVLATYADQSGSVLQPGYEWTIGNAAGTDLNFSLGGFPLPVNMKFKGKFEAKENIAVGANTVKAWKSSVTVTIQILTNVYTIKLYTWFSDNPSGQIKILQESAKFALGPITIPVPGEVQELVSYQ